MAGPYAHITLLHELVRTDRLNSLFDQDSDIPTVLATHFPYCALGAVSPDYPNLAKGKGASWQWADAMHCTKACEMIICGIRYIKGVVGPVRDKQLAWLLGYCAHVTTDVTIHPIVQAKVGPYAENQRKHRICEMNQDSYIYSRMNLGEIGASDMFSLTVAGCNNPHGATRMDNHIVAIWDTLLKNVHPELYTKHRPDIDSWQREFIAMTIESDSKTEKLFPLASIIAAKINSEYPPFDQIDLQYIEEQLVPSEILYYLHYDEIFDRAASNVCEMWRFVEKALTTEDPAYLSILGDWNLDNGCDKHGRLVFW